MRNRWNSERDRWRFAFAGARTPQQIRAALADLWSRAGPNKELKSHWELVLPLLRAEHWETARDLALVALASYGAASDDEDEADTTPAS
jgi:CRISPR-associated protein Cas8a1/Csx13